ncbi:androgen-induced gene 1 protein-like [Bacillus rossius redtenbacheri]|uniref:androgen-induced gene 1 protein-like n=1 Tax=Bacillus rossius redtenbacheri TaxID=93214 RepID=UPI002FDCBF9F
MGRQASLPLSRLSGHAGQMSAARIAMLSSAVLQFPYAVHRMASIELLTSHFGGVWRFLTNWNAIVQALYFGIALLNDLAGSNEKSLKKLPLLRRVRDYVYAAVAFPLAMFVGTTFWSLMAIDRELVFPKALDPYFPTWLNHVLHTNIMLFVLLEMATSFRAYPRRSTALAGLIAFVLVYLAWTHVIFYVSGQWVYPVLEVLNVWQRAVFFLAMILYACVLYLIGEALNSYTWAKELQQVHSGKQHQRKKK